MSLIAQKLISASGAIEETDADFNLVTGFIILMDQTERQTIPF